MTDAEKLTSAFAALLRESPFRIALERQDELFQVMDGVAWTFDTAPGHANFTARVGEKSIEAAHSALLSLWAVAASVRVLMVLMNTAADLELDEVTISPGGAGSEVVEFKHAAIALIRDPLASWPRELPAPDPDAEANSENGLLNNLFLGAASFVILHECAHIALKHRHDSNTRRDDELAADDWAVRWILDRAQDHLEREFRILAICIGFIWIGLIDEVRGTSLTHPPAARRLEKSFEKFDDAPDYSVAFEVSSYALKAFFDPSTALPRPAHGRAAFIDQLIAYTRLT